MDSTTLGGSKPARNLAQIFNDDPSLVMIQRSVCRRLSKFNKKFNQLKATLALDPGFKLELSEGLVHKASESFGDMLDTRFAEHVEQSYYDCIYNKIPLDKEKLDATHKKLGKVASYFKTLLWQRHKEVCRLVERQQKASTLLEVIVGKAADMDWSVEPPCDTEY